MSDQISYTVTGSIKYNNTATVYVTNVSPKYIEWNTQTNISITVTNLESGIQLANVSVKIDGRGCTVLSASSGTIIVTAPAHPDAYQQSNGNL